MRSPQDALDTLDMLRLRLTKATSSWTEGRDKNAHEIERPKLSQH